jgi:arginase family enzyme
MVRHKPITPQQQPKFAGIKTYMRLPYLKTTRGIDFAVVGIPWDGATSYRTGQRLAPDAIRKVSVTLRSYNVAQNVAIFEHCSGKVFVTFDIDVVDPAFAPGTGTPEVGGFTSAEAIDLIRGLKGLNFVGFDVVEVLPDYDVAEITALLAANIVYEFLSLIALKKMNDRGIA